VLIVSAEIKEDWIVSTKIDNDVKNIEIYGVLNFGWICPTKDGNSFCSDIAKGIRVAERKPPFRFPKIEIKAPMAIKPAPKLPRKRLATSAKGLSDFANSGRVPRETT